MTDETAAQCENGYLTVPEAAALLGVGMGAVRAYARSGRLSGAVRTGPRASSPWRIPLTSVRRFDPPRPALPRGRRGTGIAADIRREHPDWTDEQGRAEYRRRVRERQNAYDRRRKAELKAAKAAANGREPPDMPRARPRQETGPQTTAAATASSLLTISAAADIASEPGGGAP